MAPEPHTDGRVSCPECDAINAPDAKFCADCGCMLADEKAPRGRRAAAADAVEKSRARREFARIKSTVVAVRLVFLVSAVLAAVQVAMWNLVMLAVETEQLGALYVPITILVYGQLALMIVGGLLVVRAPLVWTVVGACYWTLNTAIGWWMNAGAINVATILTGFHTLLVLAFWFGVAQAARIQRLMAENPELSLERKGFDPSRRVAGGVAAKTHARRRRDRGEAWSGRLKVLGIAAGGLVVVVAAIWFLTRPPAVDSTLERFATAWRRSDVDAIQEMVARGRVREGLERRGWLPALPELGEATVRAGSTSATAKYACGEGDVTVAFERVGADWRIRAVELPPIAPAPLQPAIDAFRAAWGADGMDPLVGLFRPGSRERLGGALRRIFERRGWGERRPELDGTDPGRIRNGRVRVLFGLEHDELSVVFEYWHPQWHVVALSPPGR